MRYFFVAVVSVFCLLFLFVCVSSPGEWNGFLTPVLGDAYWKLLIWESFFLYLPSTVSPFMCRTDEESVASEKRDMSNFFES